MIVSVALILERSNLTLVHTVRKNYRVQTDKRGKYKENFGGFNWNTVYKYENQWEKLPH